MSHNLKVGQIVRNFGQLARIIEVRREPYNDVVLASHGVVSFVGTWAADPSKCQLVEDVAVYMHRDGLVAFS